MPFDGAFLKTLEALNLLARKALAGDARGDRQAPRKGASIEFADYRPYVPGDEIRYIDWNVYARHGSLFVKEFSAEENVHVSVILDASGSMEFGGKFEAARELAAALGYIGLAHYDTVSLYAFDSELRALESFLRGKGRVFDLLGALESLSPGGATDMAAAFRGTLPRLRGRSLVLLLSDFYDESGYRKAIPALLARRHEVRLIHLVAHEEVAPPLRGRVQLLDLETGRQREVVAEPATVEAYRRRFARFCEEIDEFSRAHELPCARVLAGEPLDRQVIEVLRAGGILEPR
ncbi:MAG: DUF58 domain-containing protein [Planctomycetota bacterium]